MYSILINLICAGKDYFSFIAEALLPCIFSVGYLHSIQTNYSFLINLTDKTLHTLLQTDQPVTPREPYAIRYLSSSTWKTV